LRGSFDIIVKFLLLIYCRANECPLLRKGKPGSVCREFDGYQGYVGGIFQGSKNPGFLKKPNPVGFIGFRFFLDKQEKIGKIIQKALKKSLKLSKILHY